MSVRVVLSVEGQPIAEQTVSEDSLDLVKWKETVISLSQTNPPLVPQQRIQVHLIRETDSDPTLGNPSGSAAARTPLGTFRHI